MSYILLENTNLIYEIKKQKTIKDLFLKDKDIKENKIHAIKDMNLELKDGDRLGIIGPNGAGKSTFLKMIAGIYPHDYGKLEVSGKIACLFELATGFEMEATGWENIKLRGLMLGETPKNMDSKMQEIANFSELGEYLNIPVKYYSSGMFMRLAFSISTAIEPDILLLDEVVAAGDAKFLKKANDRMQELIGKVNILIFVTHSMDQLKQFCNKCIWIEKGQIKMYGSPEEVSKKYLE